MKTKRILSLLLAVMLMFSIFPSALAAEDESTSEALAKLSDENFEWELTAGTEVEDERTESFWRYDNEELVYLEDRNEKNHCHGVLFHLTEDSDPGEGRFTVTRPDSLSDIEDLLIRVRRFRPGAQTNDTTSDWAYEPLDENGSFELALFEWDSPWVYNFQFGTGSDDEGFEPESYTYRFELGISRFEYMTWDDVEYELTSGILDYDNIFPSTDELFISGGNKVNRRTLMVFPENGEEPAAVFTVNRPEWLSSVSSLTAKVTSYPDEDDSGNEYTEEYIECDFVEIEAKYDQLVTIQFGTGTEDSFTPMTYEYPFIFHVHRVEAITWENFSWDESLVAHIPAKSPYSVELKDKTSLNFEDTNELILPVIGKEPGDKIEITVACPENLLNSPKIRAKYGVFKKESHANIDFEEKELSTDGTFSFEVDVSALVQESDIRHRFWFLNNDGRASGVYDLEITVPAYTMLDWKDIGYELPENVTI